jgi:aspartyl/glutamyl-tRNA(Asn/Gln) amidotransferase C subunit
MISKEDILTLAALSRLKVTEDEVETLRKDIGSILEYVGQVSNVEGAKKKTAGAHRNIMRDDVPYAPEAPLAGKQETLIKAFPASEKGYNIVRKIIDKDE